jgi:hypothetical protein
VNLYQRLVAEGIGSLLLAATVIGSGITAEGLAGGTARTSRNRIFESAAHALY